MSVPPDADRAALLLERILVDRAFREEFRRDPAAIAVREGLLELADELRQPGRALQTLEIRESRSSLAGVLVAAAAEGVGVAQFVGFLHSRGSLTPQAADALHGALQRASVQQAAAAGPAAPDLIDASPSTPVAALAAAPDASGPAPPVPAADAPASAVDALAAAPPAAAAPPPAGAAPPDAAPPSAAALAPAGTPAESLADVPPAAAAPAPPAGAADALASAAQPELARSVAAAPGRLVPPLAVADMTGSDRGGALHPSEFDIADAEGAPGPHGRVHAGYDLFGRPGAPLHAPAGGTVIEVKDTGRTSGQVFGAAVKIQLPDGRVWVFRHVVSDVTVGQHLAAGQQFATISPWTDGPTHTHIELWKTFGGGYRVDNMEDPLDELRQAYGGGGVDGGGVADVVAAPAAAAAPAPGVADLAAASASAPATPAAPVTAVAVARNTAITWDADAHNRLKLTVDPRVLEILDALSKTHRIHVAAVDQNGFDLSEVDGKPVGADNMAARDVVTALASLKGDARPSLVGSPWKISSDGFYTDATVAADLHVRLPAAGFIQDARPNAVQFMPAVDAPGAGAAASAFDVSGPNPYPGDAAPKWQLAAWMARAAVKAGLPPELPVMASLQESSLTNDPTPDEYGSIGFFQLIPSWGAARQTPEGQLGWFIDHAQAVKQQALSRGARDFGKDPNAYWEWIADVERPAEQYRHYYAKRLPEAQALLAEAASHGASPSAPAAGGADPSVLAEAGAAPTARAKVAVAAALSELGVDYSWGGGGPGGPGRGFAQGAAYVGFDCSSLMQYAMAKAGIHLERVAQDQFDMASGRHVDVAHLQPGDLVFFGTPRDVHHVGMYIGNGKFVHAPHTGDHVKISQLAGYYLKEFTGARRFT